MSEQNENRTGLPVENFSQLSEYLQNGLFMAFFAMLRPFFPPKDGRWAAYQIDRIDNESDRG